MKRLLGFIPLLGMLLVSCVTDYSVMERAGYNLFDEKVYSSVPNDTDTMRYCEYGDGFFLFDIAPLHRYKLLNEKYVFIGFEIRYREYGSRYDTRIDTDLKKLKIGGTMEQYNIELITPRDNAKNTGIITQNVKFSIGNVERVFNFDIETIPVYKGIKYDKLIEILGQPNDEEKGLYDTWTDKYVRVDLNKRIHQWWHVRYDKFEGCYFSLNEDGSLLSFYQGK